MPISTPDKIITPWATSGLKDDIPENADPINGRAGFDLGFPPINMIPKTAGGIPPFGQDFNGIFFDVTQALQFLQAGGSFPYEGAWDAAVGGYPVGALVSRTDNQGLWRNTVANNLTDPEAGGAGWQPEGSGATSVTMTSSNLTLTPLQAAAGMIIITGTLTANLQLIFPGYVKQWLVVNNASGSFTVNCKTASGSGVTVAAGSMAQIYGDGVNIYSTQDSQQLPPGYFSGFTLGNNSGAPNTTVDVGAGTARSSDNTVDITLTGTLRGILQSSGAWAAGDNQNKLDAGARANNTWYHVFAIRRTSDGAGDILFSLSATAPTMPVGYAGVRRIGSIRTDGSGNILAFLNAGRWFYYATLIQDVAASGVASPGTINLTLRVPTGVRVEARLNAMIRGENCALYIRPVGTNAPTLAGSGIGTGWIAGIGQNADGSTLESMSAQVDVITDTSGQVVLQNFAGAGNNAYVVTTTAYRELF